MASGKPQEREKGQEVLAVADVEATAVEVPLGVSEGAQEVAVRPDVPGDVFRAMDALDERQILDELMGKPSDKVVYSFAQGGSKVTGLSYAGVMEAVREMNANGHAQIRASKDHPPSVEEVQEEDEEGQTVTSFRVTVFCEDAQNGGGLWGTATQPKFQVYKDPKRKPTLDKFAYTKALSKAQRNAMLVLVPLKFREALIGKALGDEKRVQQVMTQGAGSLAELPPPLTDAKADALRETAKALYEEIRALAPLKVLPATYHAYLTRAEWQHERLENFIGWLEAQLAEAKSEKAGAS